MSVIQSDFKVKNGLIVASATDATSTTAASATFAGGVGIAKNLYVGGTIYGIANVTGTVTNASNVTITDDTTSSATQYLTFTSATTGSSSIKVHSTGLVFIPSSGNLGIGTTSPSYKLHVVGSFAATTKSFVIEHPTQQDKLLRYGSLEGPENGVYVRGRLTEGNVIELPEYWTKLVDPSSITVNLTPIGKHQNLYVKEIKDNKVVVGGTRKIDCFYTVWAERCDVDKLEVEVNK